MRRTNDTELLQSAPRGDHPELVPALRALATELARQAAAVRQKVRVASDTQKALLSDATSR